MRAAMVWYTGLAEFVSMYTWRYSRSCSRASSFTPRTFEKACRSSLTACFTVFSLMPLSTPDGFTGAPIQSPVWDLSSREDAARGSSAPLPRPHRISLYAMKTQ